MLSSSLSSTSNDSRFGSIRVRKKNLSLVPLRFNLKNQGLTQIHIYEMFDYR